VLTFRVLDLDLPDGACRLTLASLVDGNHPKLVFAVLDEVCHIEDGGWGRHLVNPAPTVIVRVLLLDDVAHNTATTVARRLLPSEADKVPSHLLDVGNAGHPRAV